MFGAQNRFGARHNHRAMGVPVTALGIVTLVVLTRFDAQAQTSSDTSYPYVGCFVDARPRVMPRQIAFHADELTLASCATSCLLDADPSWKYAGLEFGQEW